MLQRYAEFAIACGDTRHATLEATQSQAASEYGKRLGPWVSLTSGTTDLADVDAQLWPFASADVERASWPSIFEVTLRSSSGQEAVYTALTYLGEKKAIWIAIEAHHEAGKWPVDGAIAKVIGPAPRSADGTVGQGPPGVLDDRAEF